MGRLRDKLDKAGYNQEDIFFYERDLELIEKIRQSPRLEVIQGGKSASGSEDAADHDESEQRAQKAA